MPEHIFLSWKPESISYRAFGKPVSEVFPARERRTHAEFLQRKLHDIWKEVEKNDSARAAVSLPTRNGTYIEFIGSPDELLNIQSLENKPSGIKLLNSRMVEMDNQKVIKATVYIPKGKENFFLKRIENYGEESPKGKPKHQKLVATINDIRGAVLESFWIGEKEWMPGEESLWCEIWIRDDVKDLDASKIVRQVIQELGIQMKKEEIDFQERKVILIKANKRQLMEVIARSEFIAEIKRAVEVNSFFLDIENIEQVKWAKELLERSKLEESNVAVSILDTGINNGNLLLATVAADEDIHSYFTDVGNDIAGHGTKMAGIAAYGDLKEALTSQEEIILSHPLESVKILPDGQTNDPELFGAITAQSASTLYINKPERERIICMAVTAQEYSYLDGRPSSWSAALDNLIHGTMDEIQKVFIVSTGNIRGPMNVNNYPASCLIEAVEDPGQSWNAITVGAYTRLDVPEDKKYKIVAKSGELSPYSRSSITFDKIWPIKPEIVLEGGNAVKSGDGAFEDAELSVLTTSHNPIQGIFTTVNATSAATASASWLAAKIQTTYPQAWPETVRALLIHSAEWTSEMKKQFLEGKKVCV